MFVAGALQDDLSRRGTLEAAVIAHDAGIPLTWMLGNRKQLALNADVYDATHRSDHDDLQIEPYNDLEAATARRLSWFRLTATIDGGGHERFIAHDLAMGTRAFWGIAWNSSGIDGISDRGAPWGVYCADPKSYKRPQPQGVCSLAGFEWTARDLTRAYFSGHEEAYSTEPVDLIARASFRPAAAAAYVRTLVDAYAAAGEVRPLAIIAQQEAAVTGADPMDSYTVLRALYDEVRRVAMKPLTLSAVVELAPSFAAKPRAVAFPYIAGAPNVYQGFPNPAPRPYPATIDYVDRAVAMTFVEGQTMPVRVFPYDADPASAWDRQLRLLPVAAVPWIDKATRERDRLWLQLFSPTRVHFGIAIWSDASVLGWRSPPIVSAGRAATVVPLDLSGGETQLALRCRACGDRAFALAP